MPTAPRRLVAVLEERLRLRHSSPRTVEAYCSWVRRYVRFHRGTHPREMGEREVTAFLSDLATRRQVSASTQKPWPRCCSSIGMSSTLPWAG